MLVAGNCNANTVLFRCSRAQLFSILRGQRELDNHQSNAILIPSGSRRVLQQNRSTQLRGTHLFAFGTKQDLLLALCGICVYDSLRSAVDRLDRRH